MIPLLKYCVRGFKITFPFAGALVKTQYCMTQQVALPLYLQPPTLFVAVLNKPDDGVISPLLLDGDEDLLIS